MSIDNKKFRNNKTGEVVQVISSFENIAVLENKQKARVTDLLNAALYTEEIDPSTFFSNQGAYNILAEKIKNIPTHMMKDEQTSEINIDTGYNSTTNLYEPNINESAVVMSSEEEERAELARKYGASIDATNQIQKQNEAFSKILGEDSDELPQIPVQPQRQENIQRVEVKRDPLIEVTREVKNQNIDDPIITMFKKTKRSVDFKINVEISDKIPRLDFIEMMEDSYETSIIDYLSDEFTNKILQDPSSIREIIKSRIKQLVYGVEVKPSKVNDQITDSVTQVEKHEPILSKDLPKKTTTRKPRVKKESTEK